MSKITLKMKIIQTSIIGAIIFLFNLGAYANLSREDEKAVQALQAAADELATDVAKINKKHSKEYFKKKIGEIFVFCSNPKFSDKTACIKPRVEALTRE